VYQVVLFLVVWAGWFLLSGAIDNFSRESEQGQAYLYLILPALLVWWLMARHGRSVVTFILMLIGIAVFLFVPVLVSIFWSRSELPGYLVILAFPLVFLWIILFKKLYKLLIDFAPYGWR
jgi:FlaA1/EpsC-like NDP-sugar epimerase